MTEAELQLELFEVKEEIKEVKTERTKFEQGPDRERLLMADGRLLALRQKEVLILKRLYRGEILASKHP